MFRLSIGLALVVTVCALSPNKVALSQLEPTDVQQTKPTILTSPGPKDESYPMTNEPIVQIETEPEDHNTWMDDIWTMIEALPSGKNIPVRKFCTTEAEKNEGKSALVALLLAIFLGWTGAPRFYYGYYATAVGHLLMAIGPFIFAICFICFAGAFTQLKRTRSPTYQTDPEENDAIEAEDIDTYQTNSKAKQLGCGLCCVVCMFVLVIAASGLWGIVDIGLVANYDLFPQHGECVVRF